MLLPREIAENYSLWANLTKEYIERNWDMPLYHILPYQHFISLLQSNTLHFVNVMNSWGDEPYELFYIRPHYKLGDEKLLLDDHLGRYFAECWSTNEDSDAMWRIYSGLNKDGIRIRTTLGKIVQLLYPVRNVDDFIPYIGFVTYYSKNDIQQWVLANSNVPFQDWKSNLMTSLFIKRDNFSHEKEFRVLLSEPSQNGNLTYKPISSYLSIHIVPIDFIDEITLSPFVKDPQKTQQISEINQYTNGKIILNQSTLYTNDISGYTITIKK